jgi:hypothetical protein
MSKILVARVAMADHQRSKENCQNGARNSSGRLRGSVDFKRSAKGAGNETEIVVFCSEWSSLIEAKSDGHF